ncbi:ABC-type uncharacterized transport system permease subunit [Cricetibacter osteomyelitidis]|uniref:ABC-type uncharacterized transport system permease subunit n=1 Tax=Cricetibacter osteomyelitidis TaxID=1521931 RepID=A0A4R2T601_9PAST|nr:cytochrome c biogenesis protein CcsA [Cricetibacter osteomyelitidis]TCP96846.1 ABC-type uncharacterized transport system permease subunit [Cricetibacter osteomyelitidis]
MIFPLLSITSYFISTLLLTPTLAKIQAGEQNIKPNKELFFITALLAVILHFFSILPLLDHISHGEVFTLTDIGSLVSLLVAAFMTFAMLRINTMWFLLPIVYCFAIINLLFVIVMPDHVLLMLSQDVGLTIHIILALFAYALCFIATLYAIQLSWIDHSLKNKKMTFSPIIPPLMTVERHFFRILLSAEILLTVTLISGALYLADFFAPQNIQKAIFSFLAWIVFGLVLIGHQKLYWRGKRVIIYTISGMILFTIAYFGSRAMLNI